MQTNDKTRIDCNSDCVYTSLEEGECQKDYVTLVWTEHEGGVYIACDDYKPYQKLNKGNDNADK